MVRGKDAPALWAAQRKYEEKHERAEVRADVEMDVGVGEWRLRRQESRRTS